MNMKQLQFTAAAYDEHMGSNWKTISIEVSDETAAMLQKDIEAAEQRNTCSPYGVQEGGDNIVRIVCNVICGEADSEGNIINEADAFGCRGL